MCYKYPEHEERWYLSHSNEWFALAWKAWRLKEDGSLRSIYGDLEIYRHGDQGVTEDGIIVRDRRKHGLHFGNYATAINYSEQPAVGTSVVTPVLIPEPFVRASHTPIMAIVQGDVQAAADLLSIAVRKMKGEIEYAKKIERKRLDAVLAIAKTFSFEHGRKVWGGEKWYRETWTIRTPEDYQRACMWYPGLAKKALHAAMEKHGLNPRSRMWGKKELIPSEIADPDQMALKLDVQRTSSERPAYRPNTLEIHSKYSPASVQRG